MDTAFFAKPLFLIPAMVGPIFILAGLFMKTYPPKKINYLYGYRTRRSMKNQESWDFAQQYSAKEMIKLGFGFIILSIVGLFVDFNKIAELIVALGVMIWSTVALFRKTENTLKQKFPE